MGYSIKRGEAVDEAVVRLLRELAEGALADLGHSDRAFGVHEARKRFKKGRAVLRLVQPALGERFAPENARLRDAGHRLAGMREADALVECFDKLAEAEQFGRRYQAVRRRLLARARAPAGEEGLEGPIAQVCGELTAWIGELADWRLAPLQLDALFAGLRRSYAAGRRAWRRAMRDPTPEHLHDWRKRVKAHGYQLRLIEKCWPGPLEALRGELDRLAELLGDDHDLVALDALLAAGQEGALRSAAPALRQAVAGRRRALQEEADRIARRLYAERPRQLERRLARYFRAWLEAS